MEKERLNPTLVYVLAIVGLLCCCIAGSGFILAGAAFFIANTQIKKAVENPEAYDLTSVQGMKTAKIVALVILIINILFIGWLIYSIQAMGGWDAYMEQVQKMTEQWQNAQ
ncbi:MAG: hypothetical protein HKP48_07800 [Winogradskyella sp.]|uniref:CCC motif membrane protein n=1 Tax=Winogradskyella sp. TaxID=1883156 RepID=UPI00182F6B3B|nr:CCC motif membrane protein [Winogradskyella sp.]MBT8244181.1 hypothetical protein [Winogradskyella sp.]NNK23184.1 hypothetical protein [Winogradskyella sp.]